ncbi:17785_t:CDS:2, partial [Gigaspora rosea]
MKLLKSSRTTTDPKNRLGKSFDTSRQTSRKPTVITVPTYEEVEPNVPKPTYKLPPPKFLKPIPPPEPIPGATVLSRACAGRLDKDSPSNPKSAPTWEEYTKMCNQSTRSIILSSICRDHRDTDNLAKKRPRMPDNMGKTESNFKIAFIKKWCDGDNQNDSDEDSIDENGNVEPNEKYPNNINDFDHPVELDREYPNDINDFDHPIELDTEYPNDSRSFDHPIEVDDSEFMNNFSDFSGRTNFGDKLYSGSSQESQEENDDYDEHSNQDLRNGDEQPNKRQRLIYDSDYTQTPDSNDDNVESTEYISDTEHEAIRLRRRIKKTQLMITPNMDFFERLKILAPEAAALYHEMEIVEESTDTDQANTSRTKTPCDNKMWFGKDTEEFYKLVAQWGYNYSKIAELTGRTVFQVQKKFIKENKRNFRRLDDAVRRKKEFS